MTSKPRRGLGWSQSQKISHVITSSMGERSSTARKIKAKPTMVCLCTFLGDALARGLIGLVEGLVFLHGAAIEIVPDVHEFLAGAG